MARQFTRQEVEAHNSPQDAFIIIDNIVYDVTPFLEDHPGGAEVLLDNAGRDASKCFDDVGHSDDARVWRSRFKVGEVAEAECWPVRAPKTGGSDRDEPLTLQGLAAVASTPLAFAAVAYFIFIYLF
ncbi:cytochrome b5-like [Hyposmocoma kahamanoa]|uniref:cytochrome b5-like n=1 Tax=Hyposmocoma kahamanoa TaxID=1477025 RepID=UPI000E6D94EF|nr:cytochrome b5-like [Hyposmocoma kahamanoa]